MYDVFGDGKCIYSDRYPDEHINAVSPTLSIADNSAGSLTITLPVGNVGYDSLKRLSSEIIVKRDGEEVWSGRILSEQKNFQNSRELTCEGELAYLNDTVQPLKEYESNSVDKALYDFLKDILTIHNRKVMGIYDDTEEGGDASAEEAAIAEYEHTGPDKRFFVGSVTVDIEDKDEDDEEDDDDEDESVFSWTTDNDLTMNVLSGLVDKYGGHLRVRKVVNSSGVTVRYLDYLGDYLGTTDAQEIRFGRNLLDFTSNWDMSELVTVAIPQGESLGESSEVEGANTYLTVEEAEEKTDGDISHANNSIYVINNAAVESHGRIEKILSFDDISDADKLLDKAIKYLKEEQFDEMTLEVSAVDLRYLSNAVESLWLLDEIRCVSKPHGMDVIFPVTEMNIQLDQPETSTYTLNSTVQSSSVSGTSASSTLSGQIAKDYSTVTELNNAKQMSISIINGATRGYVTITRSEGHSEAICISNRTAKIAYDSKTDTWTTGTQLWRWSMGGLAFFNNGYDPNDLDNTVEVAIDMEGRINANFITTGELSTIVIHSLQRVDNTKAYDAENNPYISYWDLDEGAFTMMKGSINLGTGVGRTYAFSVNDEGELYSESGNIGGFTIDATSIYNSIITLDSAGLGFYNGSDANTEDNTSIRSLLGSYSTTDWNKNGDAIGLSVNLEPNGSFISWGARLDESDEIYSIKFMYVGDNENVQDSGGKTFKEDRLHLGTPLVVTRHGFEYEYIKNGTTQQTYETFTLSDDSGSSRTTPEPQKITLYYDLDLEDGVVKSWGCKTCYICNGLLMI